MSLLAALWRRLVFNWHLKLAATLVAIVLWVYVLNQIDPVGTTVANLPVQAANVPQGLQLLAITPPTVSLKLRGRSSLLRMALRTMAVWVDCKDRPVGDSDLPVAIVNRPPTVGITDAAPAVVHVRLDLSVSAQRRVTVEPNGLPAEGYQAATAKADPSQATVRGPAGLVQRVARVVAPINIDSLSSSADRLVRAEARDDSGSLVPRVTIEPAQLHVVVPIRAVNTRVVPVYPVLSDPPAGFRLARIGVRPSVVIITGPPELLREVNAIRTELLDISSLRASGSESIPLAPPAGCHVVGTLPAEVSIVVEPLEKALLPTLPVPPSQTSPAAPRPSVPSPSKTPNTPAPAQAPNPSRGGHR
jgi:YbbR domain-containing protein